MNRPRPPPARSRLDRNHRRTHNAPDRAERPPAFPPCQGRVVNVSLLKAVAKYGIGLGLLGYVVAKNWDPTPGPGLADALRRPVQPLPLVLAVVITAAAVLITFVRWHVLVRAQHLPLSLPAA